MIERAIYMVKRARNYTDDVEFSCEDAGRTPIADLARVVEAAINAGATTINIPDTVGYTMPFEFAGIISGLYERVPNIDKAIISVHTHDDLGLAVGNSLAAVHAGARQVEGAMNGIGERAGNCSLEEVIMAIKVRKDILNVHTAINHQEIWRTSQLVSQICNMPIPANKAIVGSGAIRTLLRYPPGWCTEKPRKLRNHDTRIYWSEPNPAESDLSFGACGGETSHG